jgi:hypothetical protein
MTQQYINIKMGGSVTPTVFATFTDSNGNPVNIIALSFGDVITITVDPTSSTEYHFAIPDTFGYQIYTQLSNVFTWTVAHLGVSELYIMTDDTIDQWVGYQVETLIDPNVLAFLTATGITDTTITDALNLFVVSLKANNLWSKFNAIYPFVGGSATTHKFNLVDPQDTDAAHRITFVGGLTHDADGVKGNGSNGYMNTNFNFASHGIVAGKYAQTNASIGYYLRTQEAVNCFEFGSLGSTNGYCLIRRGTTPMGFMLNTFTNAFAGGGVSGITPYTRLTIITRGGNSDPTVTKEWRNAVFSVQTTATADALFNSNLDFARSPIFNGFSPRQFSFAYISAGFSDAEAATFTTLVNTLQTNLGRAV